MRMSKSLLRRVLVVECEEGLLGRGRRSLASFGEFGRRAEQQRSFSTRLTREEQVGNLKNGQEFDLLVIGGGSVGTGIALDAATRNLNTALVERGDFASETSSRSTKLIWAGIRYIGTAIAALLRFKNLKHPIESWKNFVGEFKMVLGAHKERHILLETNAPHLTRWQPIAVPIRRWLSFPPPMGHPLFCLAGVALPLVFKFYDSLSGFKCPPSYIMSKRRARERFPQLDAVNMKYAQVFYEGMHNDARTCLAIALTAADHGATVTNYTEVVELLREDPSDKDRVSGVVVHDKISDEKFKVNAKAIVFAGGPFTDEIRTLEDRERKAAVSGAAGTHIVLPGYFSTSGMGLLDINTSDGRFLFFLPWLDSTIVGTTDRKGEPKSSPSPPEAEISWLLKEVKTYLKPDLHVRRSDVLSAWQGWRPLANDPFAPPDAPPSRDHTISTNPKSKCTFIVGGKWTTYREMAQDCVDRVIEEHGNVFSCGTPGPCKTENLPLVGAHGYTESFFVELIQKYNIAEEVAVHLANTYGTKALDVCKQTKSTKKRWPRFGVTLVEGYPYLENEIEYAVKQEYARSIKDVLALRMRLCFLNSEAAKHAAPRVAELMGEALNWSKEEQEKQLREALVYIDEFGGPYPKSAEEKERRHKVVDLSSLFKSLDHDGSGYIDEIEMMNAANILGFSIATREELRELFKRIPGGAERGRIYEEDFIRFWKENFDKDEILQRLDGELRLNLEKLENAPGVMFG